MSNNMKTIRVRLEYDINDQDEDFEPAEFVHCTTIEDLRTCIVAQADEQACWSVGPNEYDLAILWAEVEKAKAA